MNNKKLIKLLENVSPENDLGKNSSKHDTVLIIDGLNLFLRNFAILNFINPEGIHVGGLGGFLRSLGYLIQKISPTSVYVVFDGIGSSTNRKNILPEYKSNREITRITNWDTFDNLDEEIDAKVSQVGRLIHYLHCLPIKTIAIDKVEADDIIAYLSTTITQSTPNSRVYIVSADKDFLQLASKNIIVYRPIEKEFWDDKKVFEKFGILAKNFILYKTLLGDNSDVIPGVKGLGKKGILQKFPELAEVELNMNDIYEISSKKYKDNITYSRIILEFERLKQTYMLMDLKNPLLLESHIQYLDDIINENVPKLDIVEFMEMYNTDGIGHLIKNTAYWLRSTFEYLYSFNTTRL